MEAFLEEHPEYEADQAALKASRKAGPSSSKNGHKKDKLGKRKARKESWEKLNRRSGDKKSYPRRTRRSAAAAEDLGGYFAAEDDDGEGGLRPAGVSKRPRIHRNFDSDISSSDDEQSAEFSVSSLSSNHSSHKAVSTPKTPQFEKKRESTLTMERKVRHKKRYPTLATPSPCADLGALSCRSIKQDDIPEEFDLKNMKQVV